MSQQTPSRTKNVILSQQRKRRQGLLFVATLFALFTCTIITISYLFITMEEETRLENLERKMSRQNQNDVILLATWFRDINENIRKFTLLGNIRLFISEINAQQDNSQEIQDYSRKIRLITKQLSEFIEKDSIITASLFDASQKQFSRVGDTVLLSDKQRQAIQATLKTGKITILPIQIHELYEATINIFTPIFIQDYTDEQEEKPGAVLLTIIKVHKIIEDIVEALPMHMEYGSAILLEYQSGKLHILPAQSTASAWTLPELITVHEQTDEVTFKVLPFAKRSLLMPNGNIDVAYSTALNVPDTPWYLVQQLPVRIFDDNLANYRQTVFIIATFLIIITAILLACIWWWLFERGARTISTAIQRLHQTTSQQKQLLDSINASLSEGIILCSCKTGKILYVNPAFAKIANESVALLTKKNYQTMLSSSLSQCLERLLPLVVAQSSTQMYTETLLLSGQTYHYQISSTPFIQNEAGEENDYYVTFVFHDITSLLMAQKQLQQITNKIVQAFGQAIEATDPYLAGHATLVARLAIALCQNMGVPENAGTLHLAASLSQIGMIYIPQNIISKEGKLTSEERMQLEGHVSHTLSALDGIDFGVPVQQAISHMYERLDGSGYPNKLCGDEICLNGRILAIAMTFCAMLRPRSYRKASEFKDALLMLTQHHELYDAEVLLALHNFLSSPDGKVFYKQLLQPSPAE